MHITQEDTRAAWDNIAAGYDEFVTPQYFDLAESALRRAGLRSEMRFLDVAAGSGALSIPAARAGAQVLSIDISSVMVDRLKARARAERVSIEARVMDGHALDLPDDTFDMSGSQFGVMLFPDLPRGLRELARVTKPGGRVVVIAFGSPAKVEFLRFFIGAIESVVPDFTGLPMDPPPLPFQLRDPETFRHEMSKAGLRDVRVEATAKQMQFRSGKHLWDWLTHSNPIVRMVLAELSLTERQTADVQQAMERLVRERAAGNGPAILTSAINIGIGTK